jgi:DNA mismatch repair protein MutS
VLKKRYLQIELELYESLLNELSDYLAPVQNNGNMLAIQDCLICFANNALHFQYKKPELHDGQLRCLLKKAATR